MDLAEKFGIAATNKDGEWEVGLDVRPHVWSGNDIVAEVIGESNAIFIGKSPKILGELEHFCTVAEGVLDGHREGEPDDLSALQEKCERVRAFLEALRLATTQEKALFIEEPASSLKP